MVEIVRFPRVLRFGNERFYFSVPKEAMKHLQTGSIYLVSISTYDAPFGEAAKPIDDIGVDAKVLNQVGEAGGRAPGRSRREARKPQSTTV